MRVAARRCLTEHLSCPIPPALLWPLVPCFHSQAFFYYPSTTPACREGLRACSDNLNTRHHNAQLAGRSSVELHTLIFFKDRSVVADARVTKVRLSQAAAMSGCCS